VRLLRIVAITLGILLAIAVATPLVLLAIGIQLDVSRFASRIAPIASEAIGREVRLDGPLYVVPSYWPTLEVHGLHVADPFGEPGAEFASLGEARIVLSLVPFLLGSIEIDEISAERVRLNLVRYRSGRASWAFDVAAPDQAAGEAAQEKVAEPLPERGARAERSYVFGNLEELTLRDIAVHYRDESSGDQIDLVVDECLGAAAEGEPIRLALEGRFQSEPFLLRVGAGHIDDLLSERPKLPLDLELEIADASLALGLELGEFEDSAHAEEAAEYARAAGRYWLRFESENLGRLSPLVGIDLPPLGPVRLRAEAELEPQHSRLTELHLEVGKTILEGSADLLGEPDAPRPRATFDLTSKRFRIDDFQAEGWSLLGQEPEAGPNPSTPAVEGDTEERQVLADPAVMRLLDARVTVGVDDVVLGDESLGGGELVASLEEGRFELDPLVVRLPGGKLSLSIAFEPGPSNTYGHIHLEMKAFDLGVLARRAQPGTEMGGVLDLDFEIETHSPEPAHLMEYANGHIDLSLVPENLQAGILDMWAVNLVASVLPLVTGGESQVNCVVGLFDLDDGMLTTHSLLIDTSRIQVRGEATADFKAQRVEAGLQPRPKSPQFFSLGTPIQVSGSFRDFGVGVSAADLAGTVIRGVTDLATFPFRFVFSKRMSKDGAEACATARVRTPVPD